MDPFTLGIIALALIGGIGGIWMYSGLTGATPGILRTIGIGGTTGGILTTIVGVYTKSWAVLVGSFYGHLGYVGYIFLFILALCLGVWIFNAWDDYKHNRPISFVD